jgi:cysteine desulfurase
MPMAQPVYLDCNATTPLEPEVLEVMQRYLVEEFGNEGSRTHEYGARAKQAVQKARDQVGQIVSAQRDEVVFTSGATEANNLAILGLAEHGEKRQRKHIISTLIEHKAVLEPLEELERRGFEVEMLVPNAGGWVEPDKIKAALRPETLLVSVMHANNETGVIQPIEQIADVLRGSAAYLHVDAAQTFGKLTEPLRNERIDLISASAHKIFGPKGVGALITRRREYDRPPLKPLTFGGGQERGLRPGTLPVHLIVAFGEACGLALKGQKDRTKSLNAFRKQLMDELVPLAPVYHGDPERVMPNVVNVSIPGLNSEAAMVGLKDLIAISNGSACTSANYTVSHVLKAMNLPEEQILSALRISWCHLTPEVDWSQVVNRIKSLV